MNWAEFADAAPELAKLGDERFEKHDLLLLGTVRKDGGPRISPVEYLIFEGQLMLGMMWQSQKALDLLRDPRCAINSIVSNKDGQEGEVKLRGHAADMQDTDFRERYGQSLFERTGWRPPEPYHLFAIDIQAAAFVQFDGDGQQTTKVWRPGGEMQDRVRMPTSSG